MRPTGRHHTGICRRPMAPSQLRWIAWMTSSTRSLRSSAMVRHNAIRVALSADSLRMPTLISRKGWPRSSLAHGCTQSWDSSPRRRNRIWWSPMASCRPPSVPWTTSELTIQSSGPCSLGPSSCFQGRMADRFTFLPDTLRSHLVCHSFCRHVP